ncbi:MAG: ThiF family adenylyltransferase [Anaerolineae bacterium]|nr:ThiF family adenylyltransferase [Anaerolineae bacterium]
MSEDINMEYVNALRLVMPKAGDINIVLIGCGGTGSWLAPSVARYGKLLIDRFNRKVHLFFVDPDMVEDKNIYRQNFCSAEIGRNKAVSLAERFGLAWGLGITASDKSFDQFNYDLYAQTVFIGCVDGPAGRRRILEKYKTKNNNAWWLDCGNERNTGQVLLGYHDDRYVSDKKAVIKNICQFLPDPGKQHPELLETNTSEPEENISCAEMALRDAQGLSINQRIAAEAADYLMRMLITLDLRKFATYIDLSSGSCKSRYITQAVIESYLE